MRANDPGGGGAGQLERARPQARPARSRSSGEQHWWQRAVIYQIAVKSFQDSNSDGIGDLRGLMDRIDHLTWLGIDAVWLTPIQRSPMRDFGYDIADFCSIDPSYGTLDDFDELLATLHARDIKLVLLCVPNHTSDEHPWVAQSRSCRAHPKRD